MPEEVSQQTLNYRYYSGYYYLYKNVRFGVPYWPSTSLFLDRFDSACLSFWSHVKPIFRRMASRFVHGAWPLQTSASSRLTVLGGLAALAALPVVGCWRISTAVRERKRE